VETRALRDPGWLTAVFQLILWRDVIRRGTHMEAIFSSVDDLLGSLEDVKFGGIAVITLATWFAAGIVASVLLMGRRPIGRLGDMIAAFSSPRSWERSSCF
jgi:hypothetical protein